MSIRQQVIATAQVYLRRFYVKVPIRQTNPYIIMATALYLACKMEESPQHIRIIVSEARAVWSGSEHFPMKQPLADQQDLMLPDVAKVGEFEFYLISEMNSQLIVHHPYRSLQELQATLNMAPDEISLAWSVINDHYMTDLPLLYPPHIIAVTAIFLALTLKPTQAGLQAAASTAAALSNTPQLLKQPSSADARSPNIASNKVQNFVAWLAEGEVDIKAVVDCSQEIISLYAILEEYKENTCKEQIAAYMKKRGLV